MTHFEPTDAFSILITDANGEYWQGDAFGVENFKSQQNGRKVMKLAVGRVL